MEITYDLRRRLARKTAIEINQEVLSNNSPFFKGVNAAIVCYMVMNETTHQYDAYCEWLGGDTASVSAEIVTANMDHKPKPGDWFALEGLDMLLVEYSQLGDFWYVRQRNG